MPSVDKAIINPFEPLGVGEALLVAVCGLVIVFVMLAMLMAWSSWSISKIVAAIEGKGKAACRTRSQVRCPCRQHRQPPPPPLRWMRVSWLR